MKDTVVKKNVTDGELKINTELYTPHSITFHNEKGNIVGELEFTKEGMKFT